MYIPHFRPNRPADHTLKGGTYPYGHLRGYPRSAVTVSRKQHLLLPQFFCGKFNCKDHVKDICCIFRVKNPFSTIRALSMSGEGRGARGEAEQTLLCYFYLTQYLKTIVSRGIVD